MAVSFAIYAGGGPGPAHLQGEMAGEVTIGSAILQTRLTAFAVSSDGDVKGFPGVVRFEVDKDKYFSNPIRTDWLTAAPDRDFIVRKKVGGLEPDTLYYYRILYGPSIESVDTGPAGKFRTLPGPDISREYRLAVVT